MGIWTLEGKLDGTIGGAVMVDSVTMTAFGPVFDDAEDIDAFIVYARACNAGDLRALTAAELDNLHTAWREGHPVGDLSELLQLSLTIARARKRTEALRTVRRVK